MSTSTCPPGATKHTLQQDPTSVRGASPVSLASVWATAFSKNLPGARHGYAEADPTSAVWLATLEEWHKTSPPVWLELALRADPDHWFEGISDPWRSIETPKIDWSDVEPALERLGVITKDIANVMAWTPPVLTPQAA